VQQAEEAAAEAETQRPGGLGLEGEGGVVEAQLLQRLAQSLELSPSPGNSPAKTIGFGSR